MAATGLVPAAAAVCPAERLAHLLRRPLRRFVLGADNPARAQAALADLGLRVAPCFWATPSGSYLLGGRLAPDHPLRTEFLVPRVAAAAAVLEATLHPLAAKASGAAFRAALAHVDATAARPANRSKATSIWTHLQTSAPAAVRHALHGRAGMTLDRAVAALRAAIVSPAPATAAAARAAAQAIRVGWDNVLRGDAAHAAAVSALSIAGVATHTLTDADAHMLLTAPASRIALWLQAPHVDEAALYYAAHVPPGLATTVTCGADARLH